MISQKSFTQSISESISICPGCNLMLPVVNNPPEPHYRNSPECEQLLMDLSYYTLSLQTPEFIHQLVVDAYPAQHYGPMVKPITITFALIGLYLANEHGYSGRKVQLAHLALARKNKIWPNFTRPQQQAKYTIQDVLNAPAGKERDQMIKNWSRSVWEIWSAQQEQVRQLARKYLEITETR